MNAKADWVAVSSLTRGDYKAYERVRTVLITSGLFTAYLHKAQNRRWFTHPSMARAVRASLELGLGKEEMKKVLIDMSTAITYNLTLESGTEIDLEPVQRQRISWYDIAFAVFITIMISLIFILFYVIFS